MAFQFCNIIHIPDFARNNRFGRGLRHLLLLCLCEHILCLLHSARNQGKGIRGYVKFFPIPVARQIPILFFCLAS